MVEACVIYSEKFYQNLKDCFTDTDIEEGSCDGIRLLRVSKQYFVAATLANLSLKLMISQNKLTRGLDELQKIILGFIPYELFDRIRNDFSAYLNRNDEIHLDGFMQFRFKRYKEEIDNMIYSVIGDYCAEQKYHELLDTIKYYVDDAEPQSSELHISAHRGKLFMEELLDATLDTLPDKIILHGKSCLREEQLLQLEYIFGKRLVYGN